MMSKAMRTHAFFFFGCSGIGKSTLISLLVELDQAYQARLVTTRPKRGDDVETKFEYVTRETFDEHYRSGAFAYHAIDDKTPFVAYGIRKDEFNRGRPVLCHGSPHALPDSRVPISHTLVLLEGDALKGLRLRNADAKECKERQLANEELRHRYYENARWRSNIHIIVRNAFTKRKDLLDEFYAQLSRRRVCVAT